MLKDVFLKDPPPDYESEAYATDRFFRMFTSFGFLGVLLCIGKLLRVKVPAFRKINMPVCLMSGMLGLIFKESVGMVSPNSCAWLKHFFMAGWGDLAYMCYVVIFGTMFIGAEVPSVKEIWMTGSPQMAFGMACQHGVWITALITTQLLIGAGFKIPGYFGAAVPLGFVGSHGAATQFEATFTEMSWDAGFNLVLMNATFGLMGGLLAGTVVVNVILKLGLIKREEEDEAKPGTAGEDDSWMEVGLIPKAKQEPIGYRTTAAESMESVVLHLGLIGVMLMIGYSAKQILTAIENTSDILKAVGLLSAIPFFTCCMLTGLAINTLLIKLDLAFMIDKETIDTIGTICLEVLICAAIPTTDLSGGLDAVTPFFACCCSVFLFMLVMLFVVAPLMFPNYPYQRGLFEFGQSTASTPMGFMLIKMADPKCPPIVYKSIGCYVLMDGPNYGIWMAVVSVTFPSAGAGTKLLMYSGTYWTLWLVLYFVVIRRTFGSPEVMGTSESPKEDSFAPMASGAGTAVSAKRMSSHGLTQSEDSQRRSSTRQRTSTNSSQIIEMSSRPSISGDGS
jgi:ESS family glutamate:Na+ symporter